MCNDWISHNIEIVPQRLPLEISYIWRLVVVLGIGDINWWLWLKSFLLRILLLVLNWVHVVGDRLVLHILQISW